MSETLFDGVTPPEDETVPAFTDLVGEGKKYKDQEAAAKAIYEKDRFIEQLKAENAQFRQTAEQALKMDDFLDRLNSIQQVPPVETREPPAADKTGLTEKDVEQLLQRQLTELEKRTLMQRNLDTVRDELAKKFGSGYKTRLKELTNELGVGEQFMNSLAAEQPKAFMRLVSGLPAKQESLVTPPTGSPPAAEMTQPQGIRRRSYYDKIRKEDPRAYRSMKVQQQMFQDMEAQGEAFLD